VLTQFNKSNKYLVSIGQVEVACQHKVTRTPVVFPHHGVHVLYRTITKGSVPKVAHVKLTGKWQVSLCPFRIFKEIRTVIAFVLKVLVYIGKDLLNRVFLVGSFPKLVLHT
jgi:hypothetical protein